MVASNIGSPSPLSHIMTQTVTSSFGMMFWMESYCAEFIVSFGLLNYNVAINSTALVLVEKIWHVFLKA